MENQPYRPAIQTKRFLDCQGRMRDRVRYEGQRRWYRGLANAQFAHARRRDMWTPEARS